MLNLFACAVVKKLSTVSTLQQELLAPCDRLKVDFETFDL